VIERQPYTVVLYPLIRVVSAQIEHVLLELNHGDAGCPNFRSIVFFRPPYKGYQ
jgi:hypothetical protein